MPTKKKTTAVEKTSIEDIVGKPTEETVKEVEKKTEEDSGCFCCLKKQAVESEATPKHQLFK
jgi:hypothetical protein